MKRKLFFAAVGLGLAQPVFLSLDAIAQENPRPLDEVVVTASRSPKKQSEIGKVVRVITSKELEKSQGRTLPEVLNNTPGLTLSGTGMGFGSNISVFMRGASIGNTLILIDGIPVNNASYINSEYDISAIPVDQVERVEILRGVNSTLYGSDAVAGVINIITKQPKNEKFQGNVLLTGGSYDTYKAALNLNGSIGNTGIAVNYSNTTSKGFSTADDNGSQDFDRDGLRQHALNTRLNQKISDKFSLSASLQLMKNDFDMDAGAFADDKDFEGKYTFLFGGVNAKYILQQGVLNFNVNQNNVWYKFINQPGDGSGYSLQDNAGKITYTEAVLNQNISSKIDLTAGVNYRYTQSEQLYESLSEFGPYRSYLPAGDANNDIFSGFASFFLKDIAGFNFELGGRYNHHSEYGNNYTYTINPSYLIAERFKLFASVASAYKVPSIYQLYSQFGNLELKPESSVSYEAGLDLELIPAKLSLNTSLFKRDISERIDFYTDPQTFASQYRNMHEQHDKGLEIELDAHPFKDFSFSAWYAYVEGEGADAEGNKIDYLLRRPKNTFGAKAGYQFSKSLSANLIYKYTGSRFDVIGYPPVTEMQHAYTIVDAYVQFSPLSRLALFADVKNIFDESYTEWVGYSTRGRNFNAGLRYRIQ